MKALSHWILSFILLGHLYATDKVATILTTIPIYHKWEDAEVQYAKIPHVGWDLNNFWRCEFYSTEYTAGHSNITQDINLVSLYGLKIHYSIKNQKEHINISTKHAKQPKEFKFTITEVADITAVAIRTDFPNKDYSLIYIDETLRN